MNVVCQIASDDQYHYGFNGQMKVNEWAGVGNHNTALFWEYNTQTGRRLNKAPIYIPSVSQYAGLNNSPILLCDPLGDYSEIGAMWRNKIYGGNGISYTKRTGEWGFEYGNENGVSYKDGSHVGSSFKNGNLSISSNITDANGNYNLLQAAERNIGRNDENRKKVEMTEQGMKVWLGMGAAPILGTAGFYSGFLGLSTELWGTKAFLSMGSQGLINGWKEIDFADVAGDAFMTPGLNALFGGGIDLKPFAAEEIDRFRFQGVYKSKSAIQFGIDATIGFGFGTIGDAT